MKFLVELNCIVQKHSKQKEDKGKEGISRSESKFCKSNIKP